MSLSCKSGLAFPFLRVGLLFLFFMGNCSLLFANDLSPSDTLKLYIQEQVKLEVKQQLDWSYWIFGAAAGLLTLWSIVAWFYRIRKVAEQQIQLKAAAIIDTKISEKIDVKTDLIRSYFQRLEIVAIGAMQFEMPWIIEMTFDNPSY